MSEPTPSAGAMPVVAGATPAQTGSTGAPPPTQNPSVQPPATGAPDELGEAGKKALDTERTARKAAERELAVLRDEKTKREASELSETDRLKKEKADLEARLADREKAAKESRATSAIVAAAAKAGFADPDDAVVFLRDQVEYDDDGAPKGVTALVEDLKKRKPNLLASHVRPTGSNDGGTRGTGASALTEAQIKAMTPAEYASRRTEIMDWLARRQT